MDVVGSWIDRICHMEFDVIRFSNKRVVISVLEPQTFVFSRRTN